MEQPKNQKTARRYDARPDAMDFRDRIYNPSLIEVAAEKSLEEYLKYKVPVLDQIDEGACIGYALATMIHYQLRSRKGPQKKTPDNANVSIGMLYEIAKRYDEWPNRNYLGSSARGAMKGWYKHGVCAESLWPYDPKNRDRLLSDDRAADAATRPLGVYYRVPSRDLNAMHCALTECGVLFAASVVHGGWKKVGEKLPKAKAVIERESRTVGGHAFAIVGYDAEGFWVQNSWGKNWGFKGCAKLRYDDWLANGQDVWAGRLGVPLLLSGGVSMAKK